MANAQQLQVDAAHAVDDLVVLGAGCVRIGVGAIRQVDAGGVDVDVVKQVAVHEAPVAFRVVLGQAGVPPVARPSTQLGFMMTCAEIMFAALRDMSA